MEVISYKELRKNLAKNLNSLSDNNKVIKVESSKGRNVVIMTLNEYNALQETLYLIKSKTNQKRLDEAITEMERN